MSNPKHDLIIQEVKDVLKRMIENYGDDVENPTTEDMVYFEGYKTCAEETLKFIEELEESFKDYND